LASAVLQDEFYVYNDEGYDDLKPPWDANTGIVLR